MRTEHGNQQSRKCTERSQKAGKEVRPGRGGELSGVGKSMNIGLDTEKKNVGTIQVRNGAEAPASPDRGQHFPEQRGQQGHGRTPSLMHTWHVMPP